MAALMLPESIIVLSYSNHQLLTTIKQKELEAKYYGVPFVYNARDMHMMSSDVHIIIIMCISWLLLQFLHKRHPIKYRIRVNMQACTCWMFEG